MWVLLMTTYLQYFDVEHDSVFFCVGKGAALSLLPLLN